MENEPIARNPEGLKRTKIVEDFLSRVLTDSTIKTYEEAGDRMVAYFPEWKDQFKTEIENGQTKKYVPEDAIVLSKLTLMSIFSHSKKTYEKILTHQAALVKAGVYVDSQVYKDAVELMGDWELAYKSSLHAVRKEKEAKEEAKSITDDVSDLINSEFASRLEKDNSPESAQDRTMKAYMIKFMSSYLEGVGGFSSSMPLERRMEILLDQFDLFQNNEISRLQKNNTEVAKWHIKVVGNLKLEMGADMINQRIMDYLDKNKDNPNIEFLDQWDDLQKLFVEAGQTEREKLEP